MKKPVPGRPETVVLTRILLLDCIYGSFKDKGANPDLLVHEEYRFFSIVDTRAGDLVSYFNDGSCPFSGHRRIGNALRSLRNKRLVERYQESIDGNKPAGQYRYRITDLGREKLKELDFVRPVSALVSTG